MGVLGIGGLFFRAADPDALAAWYRRYLGIGAGCSAEGAGAPAEDWCWTAQGGPVMFAPFPAATDYIPSGKQWMLNLRVTELDALVASLRAAGIAIVTDPAWDTAETGRFARLHDPEGNAIELWEPPADD